MIDHLEHYLRTNLRITTEKSRKLNRINYRQFAEYLKHEPLLTDLCDDQVAGFMTWLSNAGRAVSTVNMKRAYLVAFWRWCHQRRLVDVYPTIHNLPEPDPYTPAWTIAELRLLMAACGATAGYFGNGIRQADFWTAYHRVLLDTAERKSAILDSQWGWYDLSTGLLQIPAEARKGRRKKAAYRLRDKTILAIRTIREPQRQLVFEWTLSASSFDNHYRRLLVRAGLPTDGKHSQRMRRTHASHLVAAGGDATKSLMHSRASITERYYFDPRIVGIQTPTDLLPEI